MPSKLKKHSLLVHNPLFLLGVLGINSFLSTNSEANIHARSVIPISNSSQMVLLDASSSPRIYSLPSAVLSIGQILEIKRTDNSEYSVTIQPASPSETIDGNSSVNLSHQFDALRMASNGTDWNILNRTDLSFATGTLSSSSISGLGPFATATASAALDLLAVYTGDTGTGGAKGLVPAPSAGDAASGKFLKADGTWATVPSSTSNSNTVAVTSNYIATLDDDVITASGGVIEITLPAASSKKSLTIKKTDSSPSNVITITRSGSDLIDSWSSVKLHTQFESVTLIADGGTHWNITSFSPGLSASYTPTISMDGSAPSINIRNSVLTYKKVSVNTVMIQGFINFGQFAAGSGGSYINISLPITAKNSSQQDGIGNVQHFGGSAGTLVNGFGSILTTDSSNITLIKGNGFFEKFTAGDAGLGFGFGYNANGYYEID